MPLCDDEATRGFGSEQTFHFSLALRGPCSVIEIISPSREKGKSDQCVLPACYLAVLNGVTIHTIDRCDLRVSLLTTNTVERAGALLIR